MMTNNKIINLFWTQNKKWLVALFIASTLLILISAIIRTLTPPSTILPPPALINSNKDGSITQFNNIVFSGQTTNLPKELSVARFSTKNDLEFYVIDQLIKQFSLTQRQGTTRFWTGEDYSMAKSEEDNKITLVKSYSNNPPSGYFTQEKVLSTSQNLIQELFPNLNIQPARDNISLISNAIEGSHDPKLNYRDAEIIIVPFTYKIDGYPVFYQKENGFPFVLALNRDYQIQKLEYNNFFIEFEPGNKIPLISIEKAIKNINDGRASIVYAVDNNYQDFSKNEVISGNMNKVVIEYRIDENIGLAYPFYRFSGNIINKNNTTLETEIITPAVEIGE